MKPPLRLIKGYRMPQDPKGLLDAAIDRYMLTKQALDDDTLKHYERTLKAYRNVSPGWPPSLESVVVFITHCQRVYEDSTTFSYYGVIKAFMVWLLKRKIITENPLEDLSPPGKPEDLPRAPPAAHLKALFNHLEKEVERVLAGKKRYPYWGWREVRNLALYSLLFDSGLRIQEALNVQMEDVDLENWNIFVRHAKRKKQRYVAIGRTARADLKFWIQFRGLIPMRNSDPGLPYLFLSRRRGWSQMSIFNAEDTLRRLLARLEVKPAFTPHHLRHAYCAYSLDKGGSIEEVRIQMGHSNLATTARYAKKVDSRRLKHHLETSPRDFLT